MSRIVFMPYKNGLAGLSLVKEHLRGMDKKVIEVKIVGSRYRQRLSDKIVKWGVATGGKNVQLSELHAEGVPAVEIVQPDQFDEIFERGGKVVCRTILNGHGGAGIVLASTPDEVVRAPLYVKYQKKTREFRVHVVLQDDGDHSYMVSEKKMMARDRRPENFNAFIRNHDNGWVFARHDLDELPDDLFTVSSRAVRALGLSFGAVDLGYHPSRGCFVFEVNTAPGCDNETAEFYANAFTK